MKKLINYVKESVDVTDAELELSATTMGLYRMPLYMVNPNLSEKIGEIVCYEHKVRDYDYFMPSSDENYYAGELTKFSRD